jgi:hypothetical protein
MILTGRKWGDEWQMCLEVARLIERLETEKREAQIVDDLRAGCYGVVYKLSCR